MCSIITKISKIREVGLAPLGEISKLAMKRKTEPDVLDLGLGLAPTSSSKPIKVYTKQKRTRTDSETAEPPKPHSSGEFKMNYREGVYKLTEVGVNKLLN